MIDELLEVLESMDAQDVSEASFEELKQLCDNIVFRLLCDFCEFLRRPSSSSVHKED